MDVTITAYDAERLNIMLENYKQLLKNTGKASDQYAIDTAEDL